MTPSDNINAHMKYREYADAVKRVKDPMYNDLKKVYYHIKLGKTVIDIFDVMKSAGVHASNLHPKLAIARADAKKVFCRYQQSGDVIFRMQEGRTLAHDIALGACFPAWQNIPSRMYTMKARP